MLRVAPFLLKSLSLLPLSVLHVLAWLLYVLLFYVFKARRKLALKNIQASFTQYSESECLQLAKQNYKNICMVILETIKSLSLSKQEIKNHIKFTNLHLLEDYLEKDQSVIIATAHHCNFEWALAACAQSINYPVDVIYRTQKSDLFEKLFYNLRTRFDVLPLPMETCIVESVKRSKITRVLAIAADQSPKKGDTPYWHHFLDRDTAFHTGTEKIARAFKYPILFMSLTRTRKGYYEASLTPLVEPPFAKQENDIMQKYIYQLENLVRTEPADWLWPYRRWKIQKPQDLCHQKQR